MLNQDYTAQLLNLEDVIITNVENISEELHIYIELPRKEHTCPVCGSVTDRVHDYRMQTIKDVPLARNTFLHKGISQLVQRDTQFHGRPMVKWLY